MVIDNAIMAHFTKNILQKAILGEIKVHWSKSGQSRINLPSKTPAWTLLQEKKIFDKMANSYQFVRSELYQNVRVL